MLEVGQRVDVVAALGERLLLRMLVGDEWGDVVVALGGCRGRTRDRAGGRAEQVSCFVRQSLRARRQPCSFRCQRSCQGNRIC